MCGIFGISHSDQNLIISEEKLSRSSNLIQHRGPDGQGIYSGSGIGLAHTRLSLLDLESRSDQPIWDTSGRYCIVYNGEVYNFKQLRQNLESLGYSFITTSDTEVILYSLIHFGVDALSTFEGMFSIALYDKRDDSILLARDRFGIKPIYYYKDDLAFIFASEIKAFEPWVDFKLDHFSISSYLMGYGGPNSHFTFYDNVRILQAGTYAKIKAGKIISESKFFEMEDFAEIEQYNRLKNSSAESIIDEAEELLIESVNKHMIADIPVGALCSGGVDSSLIMALASQNNKNLSIFHANVKGPLSEYDAAAKLAKHLSLDMKVVEISDQDFLDRMPQVMEHFGQPFLYHPNSIPFLMVCHLVKENNVKAILSGEAADECFLGYSDIPTEDIFKKYNNLIGAFRGLTHKIPLLGTRLWPSGNTNIDIIRSIHNRFEGQQDKNDSAAIIAEGFDKGTIKTLKYLKYHLRTLLHRNDCLGMASSIEARFPFLDHNLVKFSVNLPYKNKIRFSTEKPIEKKHPFLKNKWIVRQVANRYIPAELSQRPKKGFPTNAFERMDISSSYFHKSFIKDLFELSTKEVNALCEDSSQALKVRLLHLDVWGKICYNMEDKDSTIDALKNHIRISPIS